MLGGGDEPAPPPAEAEELERFLNDGGLPMTNNMSERNLRKEAVGRENWPFVGSEDDEALLYRGPLTANQIDRLHTGQ